MNDSASPSRPQRPWLVPTLVVLTALCLGGSWLTLGMLQKYRNEAEEGRQFVRDAVTDIAIRWDPKVFREYAHPDLVQANPGIDAAIADYARTVGQVTSVQPTFNGIVAPEGSGQKPALRYGCVLETGRGLATLEVLIQKEEGKFRIVGFVVTSLPEIANRPSGK